MNKLSALGLAGMGALAVVSAAPSNAATTSSTSTPAVHSTVTGNLEHTDPVYVCTKGFPNYVIGARAVKTTENSVTVTDLTANKSFSLGPVTHTKPLALFAVANRAGYSGSIRVHGNTSGTTFTVTVHIPTSCAGLPTLNADGSLTPAKGSQPTKPTKPTTVPSKPAAPVTPSKPATSPAAPVAPAKPATPVKPIGPKVQTDGAVRTTNDLSGVGAAGAGLVLVGAGAVVARRRMN